MKSMLDLILEEVPPNKAEQIRGWVEIQKGITRAKDEIEHLEKEHKKKLAVIETKIKEIRMKCKHEKKKHYADPAGGSDSFDECDICGGQV